MSKLSSIFPALLIFLLLGCSTKPISSPACQVIRDANLSVQDCPYGAKYQADGSCSFPRYANDRFGTSWYEAMEIARRENANGYSDWRLPTKSEIVLINSCKNLGREKYWTSTLSQRPGNAFKFDDGKILEEFAGYLTGAKVVLVRGGYPDSNLEFNHNFSEVVVPHRKIIYEENEETAARVRESTKENIRARREDGLRY